MSASESATFTDDELRQIAVRVAERLRSHPEVDGGVSVRASLSFLEVLEAMGLLEGSVSIQDVYDAAFSAFGGRIQPKGWRKAEDIVREVLDEVLFGKKPKDMRLDPQSFDEGLVKNLSELIQNLMSLSVAHEYGPPVKEETKAGVYPRDLSALLDDKRRGSLSSLPILTEALRNAASQSMRKGAVNSSGAINDFLRNLERFNLMRRDAASDMGDRYKFTKGSVSLVGEKKAMEILRDHYEELVDQSSGEDVGESVSKEELASLLNELQVFLDIMRSGRFAYPIDTLMRFYGEQFPTLSKALGRWSSMLASNPFRNLWDYSSGASAAFSAILEALAKEQWIEEKGGIFILSNRAYELVFEDVLPEVERAVVRGEHDALVGGGNEGEIVDVRRYHSGDRFRDISVGATVKEMAKHRRRQPETEDLRTNQLLPRRSLDIALAIDSSRSMAMYGKLLYAKKAAVGLALAAARRGDRVGVLAFSDYARNVGDLTGNVNQQFLKHIAGLRPLNSTNVEDALNKAAKTLNRQQVSGQKHIILITDGVPTSCFSLFNSQVLSRFPYYFEVDNRETSMKAAYVQAKRCIAQGITISAICIDRGEHVDREFCRNLSKMGKGRAYFLSDERKLPQTALKEYLAAKYSQPS